MDAEHDAGVVIGVDTGGTFTDVFTSDGSVLKVPSTPHHPVNAILTGLRAAGLRPGGAVSHGTTVATNAVLERKGARTGLITTSGFEDVLAIRRQNRPSLYDLNARWPDALVPADLRLGALERLDYRGNVLRPLDEMSVVDACEHMRQAGIEALAICLLFSYANPHHERQIVQLVRDALGAIPLSVSHEIAPQYGEYERTSTTVINAYVMPLMQHYLRSFEDNLKSAGVHHIHVMQSNGGLISAALAASRPVQTVLSGPAAGVVGARKVAAAAGYGHIVTFDMGGTSTDVAVVPGEILETSEGEIASFPVLTPMLTIETVGAGGGSIARIDAGGGLHVGPESAGASPGPAAYGIGEKATVTDANLVLGRLSPSGLLGGAMTLDVGRARTALDVLGTQMGLTVEQSAWAVIRLANSNMERAIRAVTLQRGFDPRDFALFPYGGAGPLHAAELAESLGIESVVIPPHPGVMAALGLTVPDLQRDFLRTVLLPLQLSALPEIQSAFAELRGQAHEELQEEDMFGKPITSQSVDVRYVGQSFHLRVPYTNDVAELRERFIQAHRRRFGHASSHGGAEIVNVRLRAVLPRLIPPRLIPDWNEDSHPPRKREIWFGSDISLQDVKSISSRVFWRPSLRPQTLVSGPAIVEQYDSTTLIPPDWSAQVDDFFNLVLTRMN